jgi:hypothetical protein
MESTAPTSRSVPNYDALAAGTIQNIDLLGE